MNTHITNDPPQETLFKLDDLWLTNEQDTKVYILKHLDSFVNQDFNMSPHSSLTVTPTQTICLPLKTLPTIFRNNFLVS